jgi:hypothetical protein
MPVGELEERMTALELRLWQVFLERYYKIKNGTGGE